MAVDDRDLNIARLVAVANGADRGVFVLQLVKQRVIRLATRAKNNAVEAFSKDDTRQSCQPGEEWL